jgi:dolichol-phosphate mannosyltransferase
MKFLIITPTYNENANISNLISEIREIKTPINLDILIIDDNSPDGTALTVKAIMAKDKNLHLIQRDAKNGLASAYCEGFKWAIKNNYDYVVQMDADLSHSPSDILKFINKVKDFDVVIGSRYKTGVNVVNWPLRRLILSYFANIYARIFTGMKIYDLTSGYKCIAVKLLQTIDFDKVKSEGYSFQIEMNFIFANKGFKITEVPIIFHDRTIGESKMSKKIILEAILKVPMFRIKKILGF